jgi:hypothetical protein
MSDEQARPEATSVPPKPNPNIPPLPEGRGRPDAVCSPPSVVADRPSLEGVDGKVYAIEGLYAGLLGGTVGIRRLANGDHFVFRLEDDKPDDPLTYLFPVNWPDHRLRKRPRFDWVDVGGGIRYGWYVKGARKA